MICYAEILVERDVYSLSTRFKPVGKQLPCQEVYNIIQQ